MQPIRHKYHLITSCNNETSICVNNYNVKNRKSEKLLKSKDIETKQKLNFSTFTAEGFSEARPFMHSSKHVFWNQ